MPTYKYLIITAAIFCLFAFTAKKTAIAQTNCTYIAYTLANPPCKSAYDSNGNYLGNYFDIYCNLLQPVGPHTSADSANGARCASESYGQICIDEPAATFGYNAKRCDATPIPTLTPTAAPQCVTALNCPAPANPNCQSRSCTSGTCGVTNFSYGTACPNPNTDIQDGTAICNGTGSCLVKTACDINGGYCSNSTNLSNLCKAGSTPDYADISCSSQGSSYLCCMPSAPTPGRTATQEQCNAQGTAWVTVAANVCVVSSSCSVPPVPTPTPTPVPCQVTTFPSSHNNLVVGGAGGLIQAQVSSGQGTATIKQMRFGSYNTSISTVNPISDSVPDLSSKYNTTAGCITEGNTAVWATADLSDGRTCPSAGTADTNIFCVAPTPTLTPTLTPVPGTVMIQGHFVDANNTFTAAGTRTITISGGALTLPVEPIYGLSPDNLWKKDSLTPSFANYFTVAASIVTGYDISYAVCPKKNTNCARIYTKADSVTLNYYLSNANDYADIYFKYLPTPCLVTTSPSTYNLNVGGTAGITAAVTGLPTGKTISQMLFGAYSEQGTRRTIATVNPTADSGPSYSTTATAVAVGNAAVWATAELNDGDDTTCQSTGTTDTDINVYPAGGGGGGNGGRGIGLPCSNNFQCLLNYCDPVTGTCQNPPTPTSGLFYTISGKIFNDANEDGKSLGDTNYTGAVTVARSPALGAYTNPAGTGNYSFANLPAGQYTLTFSGLPAGSRFTYPNTPGNSLIVNVGPSSCSCPATSEAACTAGTCNVGGSDNITNLNAGVTNMVAPWIQSVGTDMKLDSGFNNPLPSANTYSSILGTGGMPGIIFSGCSTPIFGLGQASQSQFNWQVGGTGDKCDLFTDTHNSIPSSYRFFLETAQSSGITPTDIAGQCGAGGISNCALNSSLARGLYLSNGNLTLSNAAYTFPLGNFIILINGTLTVRGEIQVPVGSTAIFSAKEDIIINENLGETASSTASTIEGVYSADSDFIAEDLQNCSIGADLRLNVAGSVIVNAGRTGGTFDNQRSLCASNAQYPTVSFIERPDFMLSYPSITTQNTRSWKNEAP